MGKGLGKQFREATMEPKDQRQNFPTTEFRGQESGFRIQNSRAGSSGIRARSSIIFCPGSEFRSPFSNEEDSPVRGKTAPGVRRFSAAPKLRRLPSRMLYICQTLRELHGVHGGRDAFSPLVNRSKLILNCATPKFANALFCEFLILTPEF
jgi:hypothetical protein